MKDIEDGNREVDEGIELADRTGHALKEIVGAVAEIEMMVAQIASASEQQSASSEQISRSVQGISTVSGESAVGVSQVAEAATGLNDLTVSLKEHIARFKVNTPGMRTPTVRVRAGVD